MSNKYIGHPYGLIGPLPEKPLIHPADCEPGSLPYKSSHIEWQAYEKLVSSLPIIPCVDWEPEPGKEYDEKEFRWQYQYWIQNLGWLDCTLNQYNTNTQDPKRKIALPLPAANDGGDGLNTDNLDINDFKNVRLVFGLQPKHIKRIDEEKERWDKIQLVDERVVDMRFSVHFWDKLAKEFAWHPFTLALYYFEYLMDKSHAPVNDANDAVSYYQPLFDYFSREHNLTLLQGEMADIIDVVNKMQGQSYPAEFVEWVGQTVYAFVKDKGWVPDDESDGWETTGELFQYWNDNTRLKLKK